MSRTKDIPADPTAPVFRRPRYHVGQAWRYKAEVTDDDTVRATLSLWDNHGGPVFTGRVQSIVARTALSILSEEARATTLDEAPRQMIQDMARTARKELKRVLLLRDDLD